MPLPGETILIVAAICAGPTHRLSVGVIFAVAAAAAIVGDNIGFWIGDKGGYRLLRRYRPRVHIDEAKLTIALGAAAVVVIVTAVIVTRRQTVQLSRRADAAYPGPLQ